MILVESSKIKGKTNQLEFHMIVFSAFLSGDDDNPSRVN